MKLLVTGGAGYLGTTLVPLLLEQGHEVVVFDVLKFGPVPILPFFRQAGFSFVGGDIRDQASLTKAAEGCDAIIHLAAIPGYPACRRDPDEARTVNVDGTRNVADVAGADRPVVFASTSSCYGAIKEDLCTEETTLQPVSLYGETKATGEQILLDQCRTVVYRFATAYGLSPRLRLDLLINDFVYRALHEGGLKIYEGHFRRSFIHVQDIARSILLALDNYSTMEGRVFNVGDDLQNHSKQDICDRIARLIPGVQIESCEGKDADQRNYAVSYARIQALGFRAAISLERGIRELKDALPWIDREAAVAMVVHERD